MTMTFGFDELRAQRGKNPVGSPWLALLGVDSAKNLLILPEKRDLEGEGNQVLSKPEICVKYPKIASVEVLRLPRMWGRAVTPELTQKIMEIPKMVSVEVLRLPWGCWRHRNQDLLLFISAILIPASFPAAPFLF